MDINTYCSSSITPTNHDLCIVQFPSFSGQTEIAICKHDTTNISYGEKAIFPSLQFEDIDPGVHKTIFASKIFGYIGVRIIDTDNLYMQDLFLIQEGRFFTFKLIGKVYFAFIYRDTTGKTQILSNSKNDIFSYEYTHSTFYVRNTLLESVVFSKEIIFQKPKISLIEVVEESKEYSFHIVEDPISPGIYDFLDTLTHLAILEKYIHYKKISEGHYILTLIGIVDTEIRKFLGFLGQYVCILPEEVSGLSDYLTLKDAADNQFHIGKEFEVETGIAYLDPRWHELRIGLLELSYYSYLLNEHIGYLEDGIQEIQKLDDKRIEFQEIHMNMTLQDAKKIYPEYKAQYNLLVSLLKNITS